MGNMLQHLFVVAKDEFAAAFWQKMVCVTIAAAISKSPNHVAYDNN